MFTSINMPGTDQGSTIPTRSVCRNSVLDFRLASHRPHLGRSFFASRKGRFSAESHVECVCAF